MAGKLKIYEYSGCSTCKKALKFLDAKHVQYEKLPILETPPSKTELQAMLQHVGGDMKRLFNTSGQAYREMGLSDKVKKMSQEELLGLLAKNGRLVKRPFIIGSGRGAVGFREEEWKKLLK